MQSLHYACFFFFNDSATTEIYTLSLHDALPISSSSTSRTRSTCTSSWPRSTSSSAARRSAGDWSRSTSKRSEEHTSELQSHLNLVCRLLLEKKNKLS